MRRLFVFITALCLAACTTVQGGASQAGAYLCANKDSLRMSYLVLMQNAVLIENAIIRQAMLGTAQAGLAALETCPPSPSLGTSPISMVNK